MENKMPPIPPKGMMPPPPPPPQQSAKEQKQEDFNNVEAKALETKEGVAKEEQKQETETRAGKGKEKGKNSNKGKKDKTETQDKKQQEKQNNVKSNKEQNATQEANTKKKTKAAGKEKSKTKRNKKPLIIGLAVAFGIVALGGGITAGVLINQANNKKLLTPTLSVIQLYNGTILEVDQQVGATKYEFVVTDANGKSNTYSSTTNTLEMSYYLNQPGDFSVKARALGKGAGATSDYSTTVSFTNRVQLETPNIFINNMDKILDAGKILGYKNNTDLTDDTITWDSVKNASKYYVRYGVDTTQNVVMYEEVIPQSEGTITFSLSTIYQKGTGRYQISVVAVPEASSYYLQSDYEDIYSVEYYAKQSTVENASYDKATKTLTFTLPTANYGTEFDLFINYANETKQHKIYLDQAEVSIQNGVIEVTCSLLQIASGDILGMSIVTLADDIYSTDSDPANVTINV